jgi:quinol monooxygenase YgiN
MATGGGKSDLKPTVAVFGTLRFPPERLTEVLPHLQRLVATTYENDGCIAYDVAVDPFDPGLIRFSELWPDHASLERHLVAPHIEPWRTAARACGLIARSFTAYEISVSRPV